MNAARIPAGLLFACFQLLLILLFFLPLFAEAQIYRCSDKGETYFSQIPCTEDAETVTVEDQRMFNDGSAAARLPEPSASGVDAAADSKTENSPADSLTQFVERLQGQRKTQIDEIETAIAGYQALLGQSDEQIAEFGSRPEIEQKITALHAARSEIDQQYQAMIAEAERRVTEMDQETPANAASG